jgi:ankyrin repeat protein
MRDYCGDSTDSNSSLFHEFYLPLDMIREIAKYICIPADVNLANDLGATALHYAAYNGNYEIVEYLLQQGVDANVKDKGGYTPLGTALERYDCPAGHSGLDKTIKLLEEVTTK